MKATLLNGWDRIRGSFWFLPALMSLAAVALAFGVLLALVGIAMLVYFIHHVSMSIQADEMIARVGVEALPEAEDQRSALRAFEAALGE
jgi:uncharacterized membrane protein